MALSNSNKNMLIGMSKNFIQKECNKINGEISKIEITTDLRDAHKIFEDIEKCVAEINSRLEQLKTHFKPENSN